MFLKVLQDRTSRAGEVNGDSNRKYARLRKPRNAHIELLVSSMCAFLHFFFSWLSQVTDLSTYRKVPIICFVSLSKSLSHLHSCCLWHVYKTYALLDLCTNFIFQLHESFSKAMYSDVLVPSFPLVSFSVFMYKIYRTNPKSRI